MTTHTFIEGQILEGFHSKFIIEEEEGELVATGSTTRAVNAVYLGEAPNKGIYAAILLKGEEPWIEILTEVIPGQWHSTENDCEFYLVVSTP